MITRSCYLVVLYFSLSNFATAIDRHFYIGIIEINWDYSTGIATPVPIDANSSRSQNMTHDNMNMNHEHASANSHLSMMMMDHHEKETVSSANGSHGGGDSSSVDHDDDGDSYSSTMMNHHMQESSENEPPKRSEVLSNKTTFIKAVFRAYTNENFTKQIEHPPGFGLLGPLIFAAPGDRVFVHCKNFARFPFNFHPHLVRYEADEGPGVEPNGGTYLYEWHVKDRDGPASPDEPCILGAYHSGLHAVIAEVESGLFAPLMICRRDYLPESLVSQKLKTGQLTAFAVPKIFHENKSIYSHINGVAEKADVIFPSINGLTKTGSEHQSISLVETTSFTCSGNLSPPTIFLHMFTFGSLDDFHLLSTSCGLMVKNGKTMTDTVPIYSASFRILEISSMELAAQKSKQRSHCYIKSADADLAEQGMFVRLFSTNCSDESQSQVANTSVPVPLHRTEMLLPEQALSVTAVDWQYYGNRTETNSTKCSLFKKLQFTSNSSESWQGLVGPVIWSSVSPAKPFQVTLSFPRILIDQYLKKTTVLHLKMPAMIEELSVEDKSDSTMFRYQYTFSVVPHAIGTQWDAPCRAFVYTAQFYVENTIDQMLTKAAYDTGLVGPLLICQNINALEAKKVRTHRVFAPLVINETVSILAAENLDCLFNGKGSIHGTFLFNTMNGYSDGAADFGHFQSGSSVDWYFLAVPPLPGRPAIFQHTITFGDDGQSSKLYAEGFSNDGQAAYSQNLPGNTIVIHGSGKEAVMVVEDNLLPENLTNWPIYCQLTQHLSSGMKASFSTSLSHSPSSPLKAIEHKAKFDHYQISAQIVNWDYKGNQTLIDRGMVHHHHGGTMNPVLMTRRHVFSKLLYRLTSFEPGSQATAIQPELPHLSLLGPVVILRPGESVYVTLKNEATKFVGISPGASIISTTVNTSWVLHTQENDGHNVFVPPGQEATFMWKLPKDWQFPNAKADMFFPDCSATLYTSKHDKVGDLYAGLLGPILICPRVSKKTGKTENVQRFFGVYARFDESRSSVAESNFLTEEERKSLDKPLIFDTINGRLMGNLDPPGFKTTSKFWIDWFMYAVGDFDDVHLVHYHGSSFGYVDADTHGTYRVADTVTVFPGECITGLAVAGRMQPAPPGIWPIHCHILEHGQRGMMGQYIVEAETEEQVEQNSGHPSKQSSNGGPYSAVVSITLALALIFGCRLPYLLLRL